MQVHLNSLLCIVGCNYMLVKILWQSVMVSLQFGVIVVGHVQQFCLHLVCFKGRCIQIACYVQLSGLKLAPLSRFIVVGFCQVSLMRWDVLHVAAFRQLVMYSRLQLYAYQDFIVLSYGNFAVWCNCSWSCRIVVFTQLVFVTSIYVLQKAIEQSLMPLIVVNNYQ